MPANRHPKEKLPLSALLSFAVMAFTIEFDNQFEHEVPHRTTLQGAGKSRQLPWLVSRVMWSNFLRFIPDAGITLSELKNRLQIPMPELRRKLERASTWWGYLSVPAKASNPQILPTPGGQKALDAWRTLDERIEQRWRERFGEERIAAICEALKQIVGQIDVTLPDSLPVLGYGLYSRGPEAPPPAEAPTEALPSLLSKALLWFAMEFEQESEISLAIAANILRLVGDEPVAARELPRLAAVSKEAIAMGLSFLEKRGYGVTVAAGARTKGLRLTDAGRKARRSYQELVGAIEERWRARFGADAVNRLRAALEHLTADEQELLLGLKPYPGSWRKTAPAALPHYPMVLHRGGFPDGS
jgi:DNA-binding MarR family transcriptional regulator